MEFDHIDCTVPKRQGNVGVARAIYEYSKRGYTVLLPASDSDKYDIVVDVDGLLLKVQVKTSRCKVGEKYQINLATKGGNTKHNTIRGRASNDYDLLFCLTEDGACWSIPVEALGTAAQSIVVSSIKYDRYKLQ